MSQYRPPPPLFGVPFNPNGRFAPSPNAPYPNVSNFLYYQPSDPNHQGRPHQPAPYANTYPFNATGQNITLPLPGPGMPQIPFSGFGQTTSGSFPPPSYPSIPPLPCSSFPPPRPPVPSSFQRETHSASIQAHTSLPLKPPPATSPTAQGITKDTPMSTATITELEDGELSDGEGGKGSRGPLDPLISNGPRPPDHEREALSRKANYQHNEKNVEAPASLQLTSEEGDHQPPSSRAPDWYSSNGDNSIHLPEKDLNNEIQKSVLRDPTASTQPKADIGVKAVPPVESVPDTAVKGGLNGVTQSSHRSIMDTPRSTSVSTPVDGNRTEIVDDSGNAKDKSSTRYFQGSQSDLRQRAKGVLKELYALKIGFAEFVKEGIEPKLLAELYAEIGIEIPPSSPERMANRMEFDSQGKGNSTLDHMEPQPISSGKSQIISQQRNPNNTPKDSLRGDQVLESLQSSHKRIPNDSSSGIDQGPLLPKKISLPHNQTQVELRAQIPNSNVIQSSITNPKPIPSAKLAKAAGTTLLGKSTIAKSGEQALERKDYIARMLAAKAGKPIPALSNSHTTDNATIQPQEISPKPGSPKQVSLDGEKHLLIENLSLRATELDLKAFFSPFPIQSIRIPMHPSTKMPLGYCFAVLMHPSDNQRAITKLSGKNFHGRKVSVKSVYPTDFPECLIRSSSPQPEQGCQTDPVTPNKLEAKPDSKKNAQTELARQKMEALRARESISKDESRHATPPSQETQAAPHSSQSTVVQIELSKGLPSMHIIENTKSSLPSISISKNANFNIPGLFMEPMAQELVALNNQPTNLHPSALPQVNGHPVHDVQNSTQVTTAKILKEQPTSSVASGAANQQTVTSAHRKRQKAADFIDSPSVRIRKSLGHAEDTSVIIEVSEDENNEISGEDLEMDVDMEIDIDEDIGQTTPQQQSPSLHLESGNPKGKKDQPPLSEIPTRKPVTPRMLGRTPPKVLTPHKSKEPQGLEIEIELMNRKIAEMQQRIKARQNASRAQTPDKLGNPSKILGIPNITQGQLKPSISSVELAGVLEAQTTLQNSEEETNTAEAVKEAQTVLAAKEATEAAKVIERERVLAEQHAQALEQAAEAAKVIEQERVLAEQQAQALEQARLEADRLRAAEAAKLAEEERRRSRRTEIEAGIPLLDVEMERAQQKLHMLKKQMEDLEFEVQKGVEGRRALLEELTELSFSIPPVNIPQSDLVGSVNSLLARNDEVRREDSSAALFTNVASSQQMPNALADGEKRTTALPSSPLPPRPVSVVANAAFFANEHCQNSLDRKPTQNDSGELQNVSLDPTAVTAATRSPIGTEEDYEPSMVPDTIQPSISDHSAENTIQEEQLRETGSLPTVEGIFSHTNHPPMQSLELDMVDNDSGDIDPHEMGSGSDRSLPIADPNDSDDYEPPEPSFAVEPSTLPSDVVIDEKISLSPSSTRDLKPLSEPMDTSLALPVNDERSVVTAESASPDQPTDTDGPANPETNYYVPYESPLKKFKSYRYHPEYLHEVPRGFRSLTYSHGIDSNKFLCQNEIAGGTCNDDSCENQHDRSMGLSDDKILVQMGAIPEGLTQEDGDAYANGLRQIIQEIRGRRVTDFNVVASEITAYRAKFLGEKVKVLPL